MTQWNKKGDDGMQAEKYPQVVMPQCSPEWLETNRLGGWASSTIIGCEAKWS